MGAIVIRTRFDEGTESAEVATSGVIVYPPFFYMYVVHVMIYYCCFGLFGFISYLY
jgi:hypothetical protein